MAWWCRQALAVCGKDLRTEYRQRTAASSLALFALTSLVLVGFALSGDHLPRPVAAAVLWVILFFAAFSGLAHVFTEEEDAATSEALRMAASATSVYAGKLLFNLVLLGSVAAVTVPCYVLMGGLGMPSPGAFVAVIASGSLALSSGATVTGAIVARARSRGALFGALGFPVVLPLLMMTVVATRHVTEPGMPEWEPVRDIGGLLAYAVMMITVSLLVFPLVWESD